jgi:hypothetical protein
MAMKVSLFWGSPFLYIQFDMLLHLFVLLEFFYPMRYHGSASDT